MDPQRDGEERARLVSRYSTRVTWALMVLCPALFLGGMWGSGVQPEELFSLPEQYSPTEDVCLRLGWKRVAGKEDLVQICSEWLKLSDPTGETHKAQRGLQVAENAEGRLYFDYGTRADWHLAAFVAFVGAILAFGWFVRRYLVQRYRRHLEEAAAQRVALSQLSS
ncbi:MAG: hypothetical protein U0172_02090 [Nitrospiraceae bacterium]